MNIREEYKNTINYNEQLRASKIELEELIKKNKEQWEDKSIIDFSNINAEYEKLCYKEQEIELQRLFILNNLLSIQRELLNKASELLRASKYYGKPFGEKTKEKIQNELTEQLENEYDIPIYCYVKKSYECNREEDCKQQECYIIDIYYKDFYYEYDLKQEKIQVFENNSYLWCYGNIEYTKVEDIEEKAKELKKRFDTTMNELEKLKAQENEIRNSFNETISGVIYDKFYIKARY